MHIGIFDRITNWLAEREAQKKSDELYNRLHKFDIDGKTSRFNEKDAIKAARAAYKNKMKKNADKQKDAKQ
jgi:hypothetical protein